MTPGTGLLNATPVRVVLFRSSEQTGRSPEQSGRFREEPRRGRAFSCRCQTSGFQPPGASCPKLLEAPVCIGPPSRGRPHRFIVVSLGLVCKRLPSPRRGMRTRVVMGVLRISDLFSPALTPLPGVCATPFTATELCSLSKWRVLWASVNQSVSVWNHGPKRNETPNSLQEKV